MTGVNNNPIQQKCIYLPKFEDVIQLYPSLYPLLIPSTEACLTIKNLLEWHIFPISLKYYQSKIEHGINAHKIEYKAFNVNRNQNGATIYLPTKAEEQLEK